MNDLERTLEEAILSIAKLKALVVDAGKAGGVIHQDDMFNLIAFHAYLEGWRARVQIKES